MPFTSLKLIVDIIKELIYAYTTAKDIEHWKGFNISIKWTMRNVQFKHQPYVSSSYRLWNS
jgi:hypothetical protein